MTTTQSQYNIPQQLTSVRASQASNLSGVYINGLLNNGVGATLTASSPVVLTIDGVNVNVGDRVLLQGQTNQNENGIYVVISSGTASSIWQLQRSADQQSLEQFLAGQFFSVDAGNTLAGAMYVLVEPLPNHLGINPISYDIVGSVSGGSFLLKANNLSDVASVATARFNLGAQLAANIKAGTTGNIGGSGAGPLTVSVVGLTASSIVVANIKSSSNPVSVVSCIAGSGNFNITFSGDPGASCLVNYVAFIVSQ